MKTLLLALLVCTFPALLSAQELTQTVKGKIIDADTNGPLPGANIILLSGGTMVEGTSSDANGNFKLEKVPVGRQTYKITFLGYEEVFLNEIMVGSGREVIQNIEMTESFAFYSFMKFNTYYYLKSLLRNGFDLFLFALDEFDLFAGIKSVA